MDQKERARELWEQGTEALVQGQIPEAIRLLEASLAVTPTAEGYTYRGWAISYLGLLDEAIEDCKKAIRLDPDFGNPYNDIGVYLMQKGELAAAIPWLERAKAARRYEPRHFPYLNLGRIYLAQGDKMKALDEFAGALQINPDDPVALAAIKTIKVTVN
jgi:Tfp pilus assembly protein PilF